MDGRPTWTDCDEAGDYVVPNVLSPRDLVFRPDNMDETVPHKLRMTIHSTSSFFSEIVLFSKIRHMVSISANFCIFIREIPAKYLKRGLRYISF